MELCKQADMKNFYDRRPFCVEPLKLIIFTCLSVKSCGFTVNIVLLLEFLQYVINITLSETNPRLFFNQLLNRPTNICPFFIDKQYL